jgi:cellulose synthase/poly-beta-1,6-N-acetylglucosamine synthase-like glycosyltransferase
VVDPKIAILIPVYNEEPVLKGTIDALVQADAERRDIFVVDDRSTDRTAEIARQCGVSVFTVPKNGGKANAQRAALAHFKLLENYDWVIFLDGDTKVDPYFINALYKAAKEDPSIALYVGQVASVKNDHLFSASRAFDYTYGQDLAKQGQSNFNVIFVSPGCSSMYRTDVLAKLEIDHMTLAEDMDLTMQVHRVGEKVHYLSEAVVYTQDPNNLKDYHKQILRWYRGFWQVIRKHKVFGWQKKQPVDFYMMFTIFDAVVFNRLAWMLGIVFFKPEILPAVLALDVGVTFLIACWTSYRTKRFDVIWKLPAYYWIGYMNFYAFLRSFFEIIIFKKELLSWNKVKRYDFDDALKGAKPSI